MGWFMLRITTHTRVLTKLLTPCIKKKKQKTKLLTPKVSLFLKSLMSPWLSYMMLHAFPQLHCSSVLDNLWYRWHLNFFWAQTCLHGVSLTHSFIKCLGGDPIAYVSSNIVPIVLYYCPVAFDMTACLWLWICWFRRSSFQILIVEIICILFLEYWYFFFPMWL